MKNERCKMENRLYMIDSGFDLETAGNLLGRVRYADSIVMYSARYCIMQEQGR